MNSQNMKNTLHWISILFFLSLGACAQDHVKEDDVPVTKNKEYNFELVVPDIATPWGMDFMPDGSFLITEKSGKLIHFREGEKTEIKGIPEVYNRGQGGLLDVRLSPNYKQDSVIYLTYSSPQGDEKGGHTALMTAKLDDGQLVDKKVLYKAVPNTTKGQHWGSRIVFDGEGHVFFTIGERGARAVNPQDITRDGGKVYRLNLDGSIPKDNPFIDEPDAKKAIWSYGHRNPQGMEINPTTGEIWTHEHGPRGGDKINIIKKGANYGWPIITYGINYGGTEITKDRTKPGMEQPLYYWLPSIAPSGMAFVTGDKYPELKDVLFVGSLKFQYLEACHLKDRKVVKREKLLDGIGRVRDVNRAPDGTIYVSVEGKGIGKLVKS